MIPTEIGKLENLTYLDLSDNRLSEEIPTELGRLTNLKVLWLDGNQLNEETPTGLADYLAGLEYVRLDAKKRTGKAQQQQRPETGRSGESLRGSDPTKDRTSGFRKLEQRLGWTLPQLASDELREILWRGKTDTLEFKATLSANLHTGARDQHTEYDVLKVIAAFLNTEGGTLIIGVDEAGVPKGIDNDSFPNEDEMWLHLLELLIKQIGAVACAGIRAGFVSYGRRRLLMIRCRKSNFPICVGEEEEFCIRRDSVVARLRTSQITPYINSHFGMSAPPVEEAPPDSA